MCYRYSVGCKKTLHYDVACCFISQLLLLKNDGWGCLYVTAISLPPSINPFCHCNNDRVFIIKSFVLWPHNQGIIHPSLSHFSHLNMTANNLHCKKAIFSFARQRDISRTNLRTRIPLDTITPIQFTLGRRMRYSFSYYTDSPSIFFIFYIKS